ncbi:hypothetical protein [Actinophytocola sp.]|uniref:hypothetical protein n=1 Tax=Actinophytocola sp. TaxID=1872138 RepID=UPI002D805C40|nr:hypothetical protein [Actinophytocola sp.]HET9137726.1 hypothetical protein [Actinophytocola sp.]
MKVRAPLGGRMAARVIVVGLVCHLLSGCTDVKPNGLDNRTECDVQRTRADNLRDNVLMRDRPEGVSFNEQSYVLPCEDDDGVGGVGWNGNFTTADEDAVRAYYRGAAAAAGWTLNYEIPNRASGQAESEARRPQMCFESEREKGVILTVYFWSPPEAGIPDLFVELEFAAQDVTCEKWVR